MKSILIFAGGALAGAAGLFYALQNEVLTSPVALIPPPAPAVLEAVQYAVQYGAATGAPTAQQPGTTQRAPAPAPAQLASAAISNMASTAEATPSEMPSAPPAETQDESPGTPEPIAPEPSAAPPAIEAIEENAVVQTPAEPLPAHPGALLIPVAGIAPAQLQDTFYDRRGSERIHEALDIMAPLQTPVLAVDDGKLVKLFDSVPGGLTLYQYDASGTFAYYYAHLDSYAADLVEGQELKRGDLIGYVGVTGNADPLAPHLHFAVFALGPEKQWWKGTAINPYPLFQH